MGQALPVILQAIYTTMQVLTSIWEGPGGDLFRKWYKEQEKKPTLKQCRNFLTNKV